MKLAYTRTSHMPRRDFCSYSLSSSNRKEVALKEKPNNASVEANPTREKGPSPFFNRLSVAQTKTNTDGPSCFTGFFCAVAILSLFYFHRSGTCCYFPPPPPLKIRVRDRGEETMSRRSPPPPPRPVLFFPLCFLVPVPRSTK